jgi:hypothetical protein
MSKLYDVWFVTEVGHVIVEAKNKTEACDKARYAQDKFFQEIDSYEVYPSCANPITEDEIGSSYPEAPIYKE